MKEKKSHLKSSIWSTRSLFFYKYSCLLVYLASIKFQQKVLNIYFMETGQVMLAIPLYHRIWKLSAHLILVKGTVHSLYPKWWRIIKGDQFRSVGSHLFFIDNMKRGKSPLTIALMHPLVGMIKSQSFWRQWCLVFLLLVYTVHWNKICKCFV